MRKKIGIVKSEDKRLNDKICLILKSFNERYLINNNEVCYEVLIDNKKYIIYKNNIKFL